MGIPVTWTDYDDVIISGSGMPLDVTGDLGRDIHAHYWTRTRKFGLGHRLFSMPCGRTTPLGLKASTLLEYCCSSFLEFERTENSASSFAPTTLCEPQGIETPMRIHPLFLGGLVHNVRSYGLVQSPVIRPGHSGSAICTASRIAITNTL